jgi:hypothetical protein
MFARKFQLGLLIVAMLFATMSDPSWAQDKIIISALPSNPTPANGEIIELPIIVDMSQTNFRLGAMATSLQWEATAFVFTDFVPGTTEGFSDPVVNTQRTAEGKLIFASVNARGAAAQVNVLTVRLQARVDITQWQGLQLNLITLAAAENFVDLLPFVEVITGVKTPEASADLLTTFALFQNVPNPMSPDQSGFYPATRIRYQLPQGGKVVLTIYNLTGQKVKTLEESDKPAGRYVVLWNGRDERNQNVASGIYFYRLAVQADNGKKFVATRKMSVLR